VSSAEWPSCAGGSSGDERLVQVLEEGLDCIVDFAIWVVPPAWGGEVLPTGAGGPYAGVGWTVEGDVIPCLVWVVALRACWAI